jgi:hypothetical protein
VEGRVVVCSWKKTADGYRVWVKGRPKLAAEADTFETADERLWEVILRATGDGENTREYAPASPRGSGEGPAVGVVMVSGNTVAHVNDASGALHAGERCPRCGNSTGGRTETPLRLDDIESGYEGGIAHIREGTYAKGSRPFFSDRFRSLLTAEERARFTWRKVERPRRAKKEFYELATSSVDVPVVGVRSLKGDGGGRCETCGWFALPFYNTASGGPHWFVCASDLPHPVPSCFTASHGRTCYLCFTAERWEKLVGKPGTRGVVSSDVGVVDAERCEREPAVPTLSEIERSPLHAAGSLLAALMKRAKNAR